MLGWGIVRFLSRKKSEFKHALLMRFGPRDARKKLEPLPGKSFNMRLDTHELVQCGIYRWGAWEWETTELLGKILCPGDTFVDIGAQVGYFGLLGATLVGPTGAVHAFEPSPGSQKFFRRNQSSNNFKQLHLHPIALSNISGNTTLFLRSNGQRGGDSFDGAPTEERVQVRVLRFEDAIKELSIDTSRIRLIKIDVEGAETRVLDGMADLLASPNAPDFIFEINIACLHGLGTSPEELKGRFLDAGFRVFELTGRFERREVDRNTPPHNIVVNCWASKRGPF